MTPSAITDPNALAGITKARLAYNASLPQTLADGKTPNPALIATDQIYLDQMIAAATQSYYKQLVNTCPTCGKAL